MVEGSGVKDISNPFGALRRADVAAFALLALVVPWISLFAPRVLGGVLPIAALLAVAGHYWAHRSFAPMEKGPWLAISLAVTLCLLSALWSAHPLFVLDRSSRVAGSLVTAVLLFFTAASLDEAERASLRPLLLWSTVFGLALTAANMLMHGGIYELVASRKALEAGVEVGTNRPMVILVVFVWPAMVAASESGWKRLALVLPVATFAVSTLTDSQTAFTAAIIGLLVYGIARLSPRFAGFAVTWGGVALILAMPAIILTLKHFDPNIRFDWPQASAGARLEIWYAVASAIPHSLWIGHGIEATRFVEDWHMAHLYFPEKSVLHPHNGALQVWYEFGAVGAVLASWLWFVMARRASALAGSMRATALACMTVVLVVSCVSHGLWQSWWLGAVGLVPALFAMAGKRTELA